MYYFLIAIGILFLDQWTKYLALEFLSKMSTLPLIEGVLHLTFVKNTGAAFSILKDRQGLLIVFTGGVVILLIFYLAREAKHMSVLANIALSMIIGGAIGNLIDRIRLNFVVDFIDFRWIDFAVFNIADSFIVIGAILLGYAVIFNKA